MLVYSTLSPRHNMPQQLQIYIFFWNHIKKKSTTSHFFYHNTKGSDTHQPPFNPYRSSGFMSEWYLLFGFNAARPTDG